MTRAHPGKCSRCLRAFSDERPRFRPRGRYCDACYAAMADTYEWCTHCRRAVPLSEWDATIWRCADCRRARDKQYRANTAEYQRQRWRARYAANPDYWRAWKQKNLERRRAWERIASARRKLRILRGE